MATKEELQVRREARAERQAEIRREVEGLKAEMAQAWADKRFKAWAELDAQVKDLWKDFAKA